MKLVRVNHTIANDSPGLPQCYWAIEIGGTKLQIVVGDESLNIVEHIRLSVDRTRGGAGIREQIERVLASLSERWRPTATGVGFGGPVDWRTGQICCSHQIEGWADFPLGEWLGSLTGGAVLVDNDAKMAALGEAERGAGAGMDPVFYVTLGSGVGGGLVVGGTIYHGARPGESEIGHLRLDREGTIVESRCSGWAVDARIRRLKESGSPSLLCDWIGEQAGGEAKFLALALQNHDREAERILQETAADLAFALSHVTHLFHPERMVIGGGLSLVGEPLRKAVASAMGTFVMEVFAPGPGVSLAALGENAVPIGCLVAARQLENPSRPS